MRIYPNADIWFYIDKPGCWGSYRSYPPHHSWKLPVVNFKPKYMRYWRDSEGYKMTEVQRKDLYFDKWETSRIRAQACLGMLYATGYRYIKLSKAPPAGFKCAPLPVNLATARIVKANLAKAKKEAKAAAKKAKKDKKAAEKAYKAERARQGKT